MPVKVMLEYKSTKIIDGQCNCKASSLGRCSHVAALLYALEDYIRNIDDKENSCTSKLCLWNQGRKRKEPHRADEVRYTSKRTQKMQKRDFNPAAEVQDSAPEEKIKEVLGALQQISAKTNNISMWELVLSFEYEDYQLNSAERNILNILVLQLTDQLTGNSSGPLCITDGLQMSSQKWWQYRKILVTASNVKTIIAPKRKDQLLMLLRKHMWEDNEFHNAAVDYGHQNESTAREAYMNSTQDLSFEVEETGLWLNGRYPGLGASPDGLVKDPTVPNFPGLLEIKCPKVLEHVKPTDLHILTPQQRNNFCCYINSSGNMILKHNHQYYFQIQMQMALTERTWCDFVIWTPRGLHTERISFNETLAKHITDKAVKFHKEILAPEYFEMRVPRDLNLFDLSKD